MRTLKEFRFADALAIWGHHSIENRSLGDHPSEVIYPTESDDCTSISFVVQHYSVLVGALVWGQVKSVPLIEVAPEDEPQVHVFCRPALSRHPGHGFTLTIGMDPIFRGQSLREYANVADPLRKQKDREIIETRAKNPITEFLVGTRTSGDSRIWLIDGLHRGAAWIRRVEQGHTDPITIATIQTENWTVLQGHGSYPSIRPV